MDFRFLFILLIIIIQFVKYYCLDHQCFFELNQGTQSLHKLKIMQESNHFNLAKVMKEALGIIRLYFHL